MSKYIGGDFDSSSLKSYEKPLSKIYESYFPNQIGNNRIFFFETGTDSLAEIILNIYYSNNSIPICLWIPSHYCFDSVSRLYEKLNGVVIFSVFDYSSIVDVKFLDNKANIFLFNHLNFYHENVINLLPLLKQKGWFTIEDFVQAPLDIFKTMGDYSFNSMRKVADIEASVCYTTSINKYSDKPTIYYKTKKEAANFKSEFLKNGNKEIEKKYLLLYKKAELDLKSKYIAIAQSSEIERLANINWTAIKDKRVENYNFLESNLKNFKQLKIVQGSYMYLMLEVEKRDELRNYMFSNDVFPAVHWPDSLDPIKDRLLSFHIDHRYDISDMKKICRLIIDFYQQAC